VQKDEKEKTNIAKIRKNTKRHLKNGAFLQKMGSKKTSAVRIEPAV
jgi:hypothetical protein